MKEGRLKILITLLIAVYVAPLFAQSYSFDCKLNKPNGIYKQGEKIAVSVQLLDNGSAVKGKMLHYIIYHDKRTIETSEVCADEPVVITTSMKQPGWCSFFVLAEDSDGKTLKIIENGKEKSVSFEIGVIVDPLLLQQGAGTPEDFLDFWNEQKRELNQIPMNVQYKPIPDTPVYRKSKYVTVDCGAGIRPVNGILHMPANAKPKSLPILLHVHGAGVHNPKSDPHWTVPGRGKAKGANIFFDLNAHGLPQDKPLSFYKNLREGELKNYPFINSTDRNTYYMKGMIIRLIRALEFLKTLPEWNGEDIVVIGGSQGGAQALIAACLDAQVSEVYADVPAMCDFGATLVNRIPGWPKLYYVRDGQVMVNQDYNSKHAELGDEKMIETAGYFDVANFAKQIMCAVHIRTGGIDGVCSPTSVFTAYNNIPSKLKEIEFAPLGGHCRGVYSDTKNIKVAKFKNYVEDSQL